MRNERRMLSSERGYGRPMIERSHGARSLLYSSHSRQIGDATLVGELPSHSPRVSLVLPLANKTSKG